MPIDNHRGIFADKKALVLAKKYNLNLQDKNAYACNKKYVTHNDVYWIVINLWISHFLYNTEQPVKVTSVQYLSFKKKAVSFNAPF